VLKVRSGTSRTNEILSGIQFKTYFIKFFLVETKRFVSSFVNVILTWQTCSQRSKRAAESKRRALGNDFSERICYMFPRSKCRGDWDLGLCTTSGLAFGGSQRNGKIRFFLRPNTFFVGSRHCAAAAVFVPLVPGNSSGNAYGSLIPVPFPFR